VQLRKSDLTGGDDEADVLVVVFYWDLIGWNLDGELRLPSTGSG